MIFDNIFFSTFFLAAASCKFILSIFGIYSSSVDQFSQIWKQIQFSIITTYKSAFIGSTFRKNIFSRTGLFTGPFFDFRPCHEPKYFPEMYNLLENIIVI